MSDKRIPDLSGLPFVVQDNLCVEGFPARYSCNMSRHCIAHFTAAVIKKLTDEGLILSRKADGCGVALASGQAALAIGTNSIPDAAKNNLFGFKPTYGKISAHGLLPATSTLHTIGISAKHLDHIRGAYSILTGVPLSPSLHARNTRIGMISSSASQTSPVDIIKFKLPLLEYAASVYRILYTCELASNSARYDGISEDSGLDLPADYTLRIRSGLFKEKLKLQIITGNYHLLAENYQRSYRKAAKVRRMICTAVDTAFSDFHYILASIDDYPLCELCGLPAVLLPCNGAPLLLMGKIGSDTDLLGFAREMCTGREVENAL